LVVEAREVATGLWMWILDGQTVRDRARES
jgi:hypothetical protein